jgi:L-seryl-tRNA(Ser) seleniumtransferase
MIMRAHSSNYRIMGFTSEVEIKDLSGLCEEFDLILLDDLGSGVYLDLSGYGLPDEPTISSSLKDKADLVCFSGDKLLGGPQAGIVLGGSDLVEAMARHPLARAVRVGKLTLAAMEATLRHYLDPEKAVSEIPTLAMLTADPEILKKRAKRLYKKISSESNIYSAEVSSEVSRAGGGALPMADLPTWAVVVTSSQLKTSELEKALRDYDTPVICRVKDDRIILDMRTVRDDEIPVIARAFSDIAGNQEPEEAE